MSALLIGMLLLGGVALIAGVALPRLVHPRHVQEAWWGVALMLVSTLVNGGLFLGLRMAGQRLNSQILRSEAAHAMADSLAALAVVLGLVASSAGLLLLDPLVGLVLAGVVAWRAWTVIRSSAAVLTDAAPIDIEELRRIASNVPGVLDCHAVRSRGDAGYTLVDLHIHVDPDLTVREAHAIARKVEQALAEEVGSIADVLVHVGGAP